MSHVCTHCERHTAAAFDHLDAPVYRVTGVDVPMPYAEHLENAALPHANHVVHAIKKSLNIK